MVNMPELRFIKGDRTKKGSALICINFHAGYLDKAAYDVYIARIVQPAIREIKELLQEAAPYRSGALGGWCAAIQTQVLREDAES